MDKSGNQITRKLFKKKKKRIANLKVLKDCPKHVYS